jgi:hypothetical protein
MWDKIRERRPALARKRFRGRRVRRIIRGIIIPRQRLISEEKQTPKKHEKTGIKTQKLRKLTSKSGPR